MDHISHGKLQPQPVMSIYITEAHTQNYLRCTIMASAHQIRVILVVKCGAAKIDQAYLGVVKDLFRPLSTLIAFDFIRFVTHKQYVLRLQICMHKIQ